MFTFLTVRNMGEPIRRSKNHRLTVCNYPRAKTGNWMIERREAPGRQLPASSTNTFGMAKARLSDTLHSEAGTAEVPVTRLWFTP